MIEYTKHQLWPTPVFQSKIKVKDEWLKMCDTTPYERMKTDNGDISIDRNILNSTSLKKDIEEHIDLYVRDWLKISDNIKFYFTSSWLVKHKPKDWSGMHYHANSLISGVYYLKVPENSGDIKFYKDGGKNAILETFRLDYSAYNFINTGVVAFNVKAGDLLLFPSNLSHSVTDNITNDTRYSLAFNCFIKGKLGKHEYALDLK